jgi:hypothetical protein
MGHARTNVLGLLVCPIFRVSITYYIETLKMGHTRTNVSGLLRVPSSGFQERIILRPWRWDIQEPTFRDYCVSHLQGFNNVLYWDPEDGTHKNQRFGTIACPIFRVSRRYYIETMKTGHTNRPETLVSDQIMAPGNNPETFIQRETVYLFMTLCIVYCHRYVKKGDENASTLWGEKLDGMFWTWIVN